MGRKEKRWLLDGDEVPWLFKRVRGDDDGEPRGEDWAEAVAARLAAMLGVPAPRAELATYQRERGSVCRSFLAGLPEGTALQHGNELLAGVDPAYDQEAHRENPGYSVAAVHTALGDAQPPPGWIGQGDERAFDVWAGYLVFDAWIANRDRHHQNWGVLLLPDGGRYLAPTFDHGSSLGFQERHPEDLAGDHVRLDRWVRRGSSHHFAGRPELVDLAVEATHQARGESRHRWTSALHAIEPADLSALLARVPTQRMSWGSRRLALQILTTNRRRLLDALTSR